MGGKKEGGAFCGPACRVRKRNGRGGLHTIPGGGWKAKESTYRHESQCFATRKHESKGALFICEGGKKGERGGSARKDAALKGEGLGGGSKRYNQDKWDQLCLPVRKKERL